MIKQVDQPSEYRKQEIINFFLRTSVPRILAAEKEKQEAEKA